MGTHHQGSRDEVRALDAFIKLTRAGESVAARVNAPLAEHQLTPSQFGVLEALYHLGPLCQADIARKILKSSGNLTMVVDNLEKRGLVTRTRDTEDRRFNRIALTPSGRELIAQVLPGHLERIVAELHRLTPAEQTQLAELCRKLGREDE